MGPAGHTIQVILQILPQDQLGAIPPPGPSIQATDIELTAATTTSITISWTNGNGDARLVVIKAGYAVDENPSQNASYSANSVFGSGSQIGTGNYVVFNGTGNSVTVTGLTANTKYAIRVYEYEGDPGAEEYNVARATGNPSVKYSLSTEYSDLLARAIVRSFTAPVFSDQVFDNNMMRRFKRDGVLASADALWFFANSVRDFGLLNLKAPSVNEMVLVNSPSFTPDEGINGNGITSYINSSFVPSSGVLYTQNNCSFGIFIFDESQSAGQDIGGIAAGPLRVALISRTLLDAVFIDINDNTPRTVANTLSRGLHQVIRVNSTNNLMWRSLVPLMAQAATFTSVARPGITMYIGARHNTTVTDVADAFSSRKYSFAYFGNMTMPENDLYYSVISRLSKYAPPLPAVPGSSVTSIEAFGDSFMLGQAASNPSVNGLLAQFAANEFTGITPTNHAVSGKGAWVAVDAACQLPVASGALWLELAGQNDCFRNGSAANTLNKLEAMVRTLFVNHYATGFSAAGASSVSIVRAGDYTDPYDARAVGGRHSSAPLPSSSAVVNPNGAAGTIEYTFTGKSCAVQLISDSGVDSFGTCNIFIDNVFQQTVDLRTYYDNVSDGVNSNQTGPVCFWFAGLTDTTHVLKIKANGDGKCPVDFFCPLKDPFTSDPIVFTDLPLRNTYPVGITEADFLAGSARKFAAAQLGYESGFRVAYYNVMEFYERNVQTLDVDQVHPLTGGHKEIASGLSYLFD